MNTDTITNPDPGLAEPESTFDPLTPSEPQHRKVAWLPKPLRDMVNTMLDDGLSARKGHSGRTVEKSFQPPVDKPTHKRTNRVPTPNQSASVA